MPRYFVLLPVESVMLQKVRHLEVEHAKMEYDREIPRPIPFALEREFPTGDFSCQLSKHDGALGIQSR